MKKRISFTKLLATKTFCLLRQAYMSTHRRGSVDEEGWDEIRRYYTLQRRQPLDEVLEELRDLLNRSGFSVQSDAEDAKVGFVKRLSNRIHTTKAILTLLSLFSRLRRTFGFRKEEVRFMAGSITQLLEYLDQPEAPQTEKIFELEAHLRLGTAIIEAGCWHMPELTKAKYIEYYNNQSGNLSLSLEEVLATLT